MKKKLSLFIFLFISIFVSHDYSQAANQITANERTATIASFNALKLGKNKKDYYAAANAIKDFQLVGVLEVMSRSGIEQLVKALERTSGERYDYKISPYSVGSSSYKEYYAFIWKRKKVKFLREIGYYKSETKEFSREPYACDFRIGKFDFTFVLHHIVFGKTQRVRREEIFRLDKVYNYFQDLDPTENDIIMAGDFNMPATDESFENLLSHGDDIIPVLDPMIKTTIGTKGLASSYDNMFLSVIYTGEFTGNSGALDFTSGNYKYSREKISDHLPIFIEVDITEDDD